MPIRVDERPRILHLVLSSDRRNRDLRGILEDELDARALDVTHLTLGPELADVTRARLIAGAGDFDHVLVSAFARVSGAKGTADMRPSLARLVRELEA